MPEKRRAADGVATVLASAGISALISSSGPIAGGTCLLAAAIYWSPIGERLVLTRSALTFQDLIDSHMRTGIDLVAALSVQVRPKRLDRGGWKISGGGPPEEWWQKADIYVSRTIDLLSPQPWLLKDFNQGFNARVRKGGSDPISPAGPDRRTPIEKMLCLANAERSTPRIIVEACLDGLNEARRAVPT